MSSAPGRVPVWQFHQLAQFIMDSGYMKLEDAYDRTVTDNPTVYTIVVLNGKRKITPLDMPILDQ
jgi:hypothetical protein